ncbi:MAG: hypothetical protein QXV06_04100, partial [Ignisphaera sp.]
LIVKILNIQPKRIPNIFTIETINEFDQIVRLYMKASRVCIKHKDLDLNLASVFDNCYNEGHLNSMKTPNSIFLLLKRPFPTDPLDFDLFRNDAKVWYGRIQQVIHNKFIPIFIYDPLYIPNIIIEYIPLVLINRHNNIENCKAVCYVDNVCKAYMEHDNFYILLGLWSSDNIINILNPKKSLNIGNIVQIPNPLFCSNPFRHDHIDKARHPIIQTTKQNMNKNSNKHNLIIEFTTSYMSINSMNSTNRGGYTYLWLPIPSTKILFITYGLLKDLEVDKLIIASTINNFAETGSLSLDRIWINILKHRIQPQRIRIIIGNSL